jgi:hypothetical protein
MCEAGRLQTRAVGSQTGMALPAKGANLPKGLGKLYSRFYRDPAVMDSGILLCFMACWRASFEGVARTFAHVTSFRVHAHTHAQLGLSSCSTQHAAVC